MPRFAPIHWRSRIEAALSGQMPDRVPAIFRLSRWYRRRCYDGTLPPGLHGARLEEIEAHLGLARSARYAKVFRLKLRPPTACVVDDRGNEVVTECHTESGVSRRVARYGPGDRVAGLDPTITQYPITSWAGYEAFAKVMDEAEFVPDYEAYQWYDAKVGQAGLPMVIIGGIPLHYLLQEWTGYERGFLDLHDRPDVVLDAVEAANRAYRRMWEVVGRSPARLVLHGINFNTAPTPPPMFREHFLPYLRAFVNEMHRAGKWVAFHADGNLTGLWNLIDDCGFDVADCFACPPLVSSMVPQAREIWQDRIVIWGGLPSPLPEVDVGFETLRAHLDQLLRDVAPGYRFMLGITDMALPGTDWAHLLAVRDWLNVHGRLQAGM